MTPLSSTPRFAGGVSAGLIALVLLVGIATAVADVGVSISPGELAVAESMRPGSEATLAQLQIGNPGDQASTYRIVAKGLATDSTLPADPEWFTLSPAVAELEPGQTVEVIVTVRPSEDSAAGLYAATVQAELEPQGSATQIVAAAATKVFFDVTAAEDDSPATWFWWVLIALAVAAAVVATTVAFRRRQTT